MCGNNGINHNVRNTYSMYGTQSIGGGNSWGQPGSFRASTGGPSIFGTGYSYAQNGMHDPYGQRQFEYQMYKDEKNKEVVKNTAHGALIGSIIGGPMGYIYGGLIGLVKGHNS